MTFLNFFCSSDNPNVLFVVALTFLVSISGIDIKKRFFSYISRHSTCKIGDDDRRLQLNSFQFGMISLLIL